MMAEKGGNLFEDGLLEHLGSGVSSSAEFLIYSVGLVVLRQRRALQFLGRVVLAWLDNIEAPGVAWTFGPQVGKVRLVELACFPLWNFGHYMLSTFNVYPSILITITASTSDLSTISLKSPPSGLWSKPSSYLSTPQLHSLNGFIAPSFHSPAHGLLPT